MPQEYLILVGMEGCSPEPEQEGGVIPDEHLCNNTTQGSGHSHGWSQERS